jgi:hypothetical protein
VRRTALIALGAVVAILFFAVWLLVVGATVKWSWNYLFASQTQCSVAAKVPCSFKAKEAA